MQGGPRLGRKQRSNTELLAAPLAGQDAWLSSSGFRSLTVHGSRAWRLPGRGAGIKPREKSHPLRRRECGVGSGLAADSDRFVVFERAAGAPSVRRFFEALGHFVAAGPDRASPEPDFAASHIVLNIELVQIVVLAQTNSRLRVENFSGYHVPGFLNTVIALVSRIGPWASRQIASVGIHVRTESHAQMVERAMDRRRLIVRALCG